MLVDVDDTNVNAGAIRQMPVCVRERASVVTGIAMLTHFVMVCSHCRPVSVQRPLEPSLP